MRWGMNRIKGIVIMTSLLLTVVLSGCRDTGTATYNDLETEPSELQGDLEMADTIEESSVETSQESLDTMLIEDELSDETAEENESESVSELPELVFASEEWGLSFGEPGMQPVGNASAEAMAPYGAYFMGSDEEKVIYLTFDCGYENGNTEPILDALKKHGAQATFFVVGYFLETEPELVKRMVEEGHTVGNHTYHHLDMQTISAEDFEKEMKDVADLFYEITGTQLSPYYRPPQGKCNTENIKQAQELGYNTFFWSLAYMDWDQDNQPSHEEAFDKLTTRIHPGAIVLLHNTSQTNGEILDELLTKWEEMGYSFKPLSELI